MPTNITVERKDQIAIVTLQRPDRRNALDGEMWDTLEQTLFTLREEPPRVVIFTGAGEAFCAGFDIRPENPITGAFLKAMQNSDWDHIRVLLNRLKAILTSIEDIPVPTIAAINGNAHGGGVELALCCDLRVMDPEATLCMAETRIGLMPDLGGTVRLVRQLGRSRALDLIWTARDLRAEEALEMGLVNRLCPAGHALDAAVDLAALIIQNGPAAVRAVKQVAMAMDDLAPALDAETEAAVECFMAGQSVEGVTAWMQNRPAKWPEEG